MIVVETSEPNTVRNVNVWILIVKTRDPTVLKGLKQASVPCLLLSRAIIARTLANFAKMAKKEL